jgi:hypothetical protein
MSKPRSGREDRLKARKQEEEAVLWVHLKYSDAIVPPMAKRLLIIIGTVSALFAVSFVAAGCGSDSDEATLTKKQFIERAEKICEAAEKEQFAKATAYTKSHPKAKEEDLIEPAGFPPLEKQLEELQDLGAPVEGEAEVEAFLEEFESALDKAKEDPKDILKPETNPFEQANKLAKDYGLRSCGSAP